MKPRLTILLAIALVAIAVSATAQPDFDAIVIKAHPVAGQVSYLEGAGGNIGVFTGPDGVFLIDDQFAPLTDKIVAAVKELSSEPIRFLVNTHMHPDHTGGNENFGKMGTVIFGHENMRRQMAAAGYDQTPPFVTYSEDMSLHINGETVYAFKTPDAHTNNDSYVMFKESNVVHTGDVFRTTSYPYVDTDNGGSFLGTIKAYDLLIEVSNAQTKILPGHGVVSSVEDVRSFRDMMLVIRDRVSTAISEGKTLEQIQAAGLTKEYDERWDSGRRIGSAASLLEAAYKDLAP